MTVLNASNAYTIVLQAITVWREARGESPEAQRAVAWSINNRAGRAAWWNSDKAFDIVAVIRFPQQYSSMTHLTDPNTIKFPTSDDQIFKSILMLCLNPGDDPTNGSTHYYSIDIPEPEWAKEMEFTVQVGAFRFYKLQSSTSSS